MIAPLRPPVSLKSGFSKRAFWVFGFGLALASQKVHADADTIKLGFDYGLSAVGISNNDGKTTTADDLNYYSHQIRAYLNGQLSPNVEAGLRVQSVNVWGLEGSTNAPSTRYPAADGTPWIEQAYLHMPRLAGNHLALTLGRQSIVVGDGLLVSDDDLGFNALRAQIRLPWQLGLDLFTAKINEGLENKTDFDLNGVVASLKRGDNHWDLAWVQEINDAPSNYRLGGSTQTASRVNRTFYDLRLFGDLKDAYYKLELALGQGNASTSAGDVKIQGQSEKIELGAQTDTARLGRFGVKALYASGSGDDPDSTDKDESFRPTFSKRWKGLQREGWGRHFAATPSDAYDPDHPFSSDGTGLPGVASGIKTLGLGLFTIQKVNWTGSIDYFTYDSRIKVSGQNSLGAELDLGLLYRYTNSVSFDFSAATFFPGDVYGPETSKVTRYTASTQIHF
ncbi:MAG: alginate export family protein [Elusimicrobia bacterium]|nr:alginate export family protein [Elusimicrobiota bacterium]MBP9127667.1 alginate export family protein [Elusimicrobiota bacterium]